MSGKNKNYNSIVFLTTLSVYLGLVLVGGAPQVFAYAATTKNFDIQHEIEVRDDLDNKPDGESIAGKSAIEQNRQILEEYARLLSSSLNNYSLPASYHVLPDLGNAPDSAFAFRGDRFGDFLIPDSGKHNPGTKFVAAPDFAGSVPAAPVFNFDERTARPETRKPVRENTKITFGNNPNLLITNLPRASIDSLIG